MHLTVDQLISQVEDLPALPQVAQKALGMIHSDKSSSYNLAEVISVDQALSTMVLRYANSAMFGLQSRVVSVKHAVALLGMESVREMILASSVVSFLSRPLPGYDLRHGDLWRHSIGVAIGSRLICKWRGFPFGEEAYYAGLMCDIGKLAFERVIRNTDTHSSIWLHGTFLDMERTLFGVDHAELGAEMARRWRLPELLVKVIANHHTPTEAGEHQLMASVVHMADSAMMMLGVGLGKDGLRYNLDPSAVALLSMNEHDLSYLLDEIIDQIQIAEVFIGID